MTANRNNFKKEKKDLLQTLTKKKQMQCMVIL